MSSQSIKNKNLRTLSTINPMKQEGFEKNFLGILEEQKIKVKESNDTSLDEF